MENTTRFTYFLYICSVVRIPRTIYITKSNKKRWQTNVMVTSTTNTGSM